MQYSFDRSFASSVVNSALASNVFELCEKELDVSFVAGQPLGYHASLASLRTLPPYIGVVVCGTALDLSLSHMRYSAMTTSSLIKKWLTVYESAVGLKGV